MATGVVQLGQHFDGGVVWVGSPRLVIGVLLLLLLTEVLPLGALPQVDFVRSELTDAVGVSHSGVNVALPNGGQIGGQGRRGERAEGVAAVYRRWALIKGRGQLTLCQFA